jgi:uncharacterized protein (TIGR00369 family)
MKEILAYKKCFVCGVENEIGLKAKFFDDNGVAKTEFITPSQFEGYKGLFHGGILATLLDEVMIKAVLARGIFAVTAEMTVRYKLPVPTGALVRFEGKIVSSKGRVHVTEGLAIGDDGQVYAVSVGTYLEAKPELKEKLKGSVE